MDTSDLGAEWLEQLRVRAQVSDLNPSIAQRADFSTKNRVTCDFHAKNHVAGGVTEPTNL